MAECRRTFGDARACPFRSKLPPAWGDLYPIYGRSGHPSPHPKRHLDRLSRFVQGGRTWTIQTYSPGGANMHHTACSTCFLGPTRVHDKNGVSIGSAVFAQVTAQSRNTLQQAAPSPLKIAPCRGGSGPSTQMASRSVEAHYCDR